MQRIVRLVAAKACDYCTTRTDFMFENPAHLANGLADKAEGVQTAKELVTMSKQPNLIGIWVGLRRHMHTGVTSEQVVRLLSSLSVAWGLRDGGLHGLHGLHELRGCRGCRGCRGSRVQGCRGCRVAGLQGSQMAAPNKAAITGAAASAR